MENGGDMQKIHAGIFDYMWHGCLLAHHVRLDAVLRCLFLHLGEGKELKI